MLLNVGFCLLGTMALAQAAQAGAVITNGTVSLGVNDNAELNFDNRGVFFNSTNNDGTRAGCKCEGWGAGNGEAANKFSGSADQSEGGANNLDLISFTSTAATATSITTIDGKLKVTHDFHPFAGSPNLYEVKVTLENISVPAATLGDVRYTRIMDWDVEPTAFSELVTIQRGTTPTGALLYSNDNGFGPSTSNVSNEAPDPFGDRTPLTAGTENADFTDSGPADHGALFDFGFGSLAPGAKKEFVIYYGATDSEANANAAVSAAGAELYSYGQPNVADDGTDPPDADSDPDGPAQGKPNTFILAFKAVGGAPTSRRR